MTANAYTMHQRLEFVALPVELPVSFPVFELQAYIFYQVYNFSKSICYISAAYVACTAGIGRFPLNQKLMVVTISHYNPAVC